MAELSSRVLGAPVTIRNDLVAMTKPDVVARAVALGGAHALPNLASCWAIGHDHDTHCGICAPCLMRRISFLTDDVDDAVYQRDVFDNEADFSSSEQSRDNLSQLCQFVGELTDLDDSELFIEYPELLDGAPALTPAASLALYRRWASRPRPSCVATGSAEAAWMSRVSFGTFRGVVRSGGAPGAAAGLGGFPTTTPVREKAVRACTRRVSPPPNWRSTTG